MKVAVTYDADGQIFQHFGHTRQLKVYNIANNKIAGSEIMFAGQNGHGAMAAFLKILGADVLICGGIGGGAKKALAEAGIEFYPYVQGQADEAVLAYLNGTLIFDNARSCSAHAAGHKHTDADGQREHECSCDAHATCGEHN